MADIQERPVENDKGQEATLSANADFDAFSSYRSFSEGTDKEKQSTATQAPNLELAGAMQKQDSSYKMPLQDKHLSAESERAAAFPNLQIADRTGKDKNNSDQSRGDKNARSDRAIGEPHYPNLKKTESDLSENGKQRADAPGRGEKPAQQGNDAAQKEKSSEDSARVKHNLESLKQQKDHPISAERIKAITEKLLNTADRASSVHNTAELKNKASNPAELKQQMMDYLSKAAADAKTSSIVKALEELLKKD